MQGAMMRVEGMQVRYLDGTVVRSTSQVYYNTGDRALYYKPLIDGVEQLMQFDQGFGKKPYKIDFKHIW